MNLRKQYIQEIRKVLTDMVNNVRSNPHNPWILPSGRPLIDGYNRPYQGFELLVLTSFRQRNNIRTPLFCHAHQRKMFKQPVMQEDKGVPVLKKDGNGILVYPCHIRSDKLDDKIGRVEENRKIMFSKSLTRMHLEKFSPVNDEGVARHIYKDITGNMTDMDEPDRFIAEMSAAVVALEMGLPKIIEPENIRLLDRWRGFLLDGDNGMDYIISSVNYRRKEELKAIRDIQIEERIFRGNLETSIRNLKRMNNVPGIKRLEDLITPSIRIK